jgi:hypothetical protein
MPFGATLFCYASLFSYNVAPKGLGWFLFIHFSTKMSPLRGLTRRTCAKCGGRTFQLSNLHTSIACLKLYASLLASPIEMLTLEVCDARMLHRFANACPTKKELPIGNSKI